MWQKKEEAGMIVQLARAQVVLWYNVPPPPIKICIPRAAAASRQKACLGKCFHPCCQKVTFNFCYEKQAMRPPDIHTL